MGALLPQAHLPLNAPRSNSAAAEPGRTSFGRVANAPDQQASQSVPGAEGE